MTEDIEVAVAPDPENGRRWVLALSELPDGAAQSLANETDPFEGYYLHAIRINDEITIDVMPSVAGITFAELEQHAQTMFLDGVPVPLLGLEGLWKTKQGLRPKDQADAALLQRVIDSATDDRTNDHCPASFFKRPVRIFPPNGRARLLSGDKYAIDYFSWEWSISGDKIHPPERNFR